MNSAEWLADWQARNQQLLPRMMSATQDLDEETLNRCPNAKTWSPAQVLEHMVLAHRPYLLTIRTALERAEKEIVSAPVRFSFFGKLIRTIVGPKGNYPAPKALHPRSTLIPRSILEEWQQQHSELLSLLDRAAGVALSSTRVRNPFIPIIPMNLADCFEIITAHLERHVGQIEARVQSKNPLVSV